MTTNLIRESFLNGMSKNADIVELDSETIIQLRESSDEGVDQATKNELIRQEIKQALELGEKDMIIFRDDKIYVRRFKSKRKLLDFNKLLSAIEQNSDAELGKDNKDIVIVSDVLTLPLRDIADDEFLPKLDEQLSPADKEALRIELKEMLVLDEKDLVVFLTDKAVIRKFRPQTSKPDLPDLPIDKPLKLEQRFNGLPPEELEKLRFSIFNSDEEQHAKIKVAITELFAKELNLDEIQVEFFLKNYIKIMMQAVYTLIKSITDLEDEVASGMAGYVFRQEWESAHQLIARKLLELVMSKGDNAMRILKYYDGEIEVDKDRVKWRRPEIIDEKGGKWNASTISGVAMQKRKNMETVHQRKEGLGEFEANMTKYENILSAVVQEGEEYEAMEQQIKKDFSDKQVIELQVQARINELRAAMKNCKEEEKAALHSEISEKMNQQKRLIAKDETLFSAKRKLEAAKNTLGGRIQKAEFDVKRAQQKYKEETEKLKSLISGQKSLDEKFDVIARAIASALPKKKIQLKQ